MLAVADRRKLAELAPRRQQGHVGIGQAERRQRAQLFAELERELRPARKYRVDDRRRHEIVGTQQALRLSRERLGEDRKSTRLNSSHGYISYAVFCLKKK